MNGQLTLRGMVGAFVLLFGLGGSVALAAAGWVLSNGEPYRNAALPRSVVAAINGVERVYGWATPGDGLQEAPSPGPAGPTSPVKGEGSKRSSHSPELREDQSQFLTRFSARRGGFRTARPRSASAGRASPR